MSDLRTVIQDHWRALDERGRSIDWLTSALPVELESPLLCALGPDGNRHLLVPLQPSDKLEPDVRAAAVHLVRTPLQSGSQRIEYADLVLLRPDLIEIFNGLCADVMGSLAASPSDAPATVSGILDGWHELLRSGSQLSVEQLAGLFGELTVLNTLLDLRPDCLFSWKGPRREPQDFIIGTRAVEVKATSAPDGQAVRIHGIDQLVTPVGGGLMLWWMRLDTSSMSGVSVPDRVETTAQRLPRPHELWQLLARAGYYLADRERYDNIRFSIAEQQRYLVDDDFPRIVPSSFAGGFPMGVSDVRYTVDLQSGPVAMHQDDVAQFLTEMVQQ